MLEFSEPMRRLAELNQFVSAELNPDEFKGKRYSGLLNVMNGCFIHPVMVSSRKGAFKTETKLSDDAIYLIWFSDSYDNNAHAVKLSDESLAKFEKVMRAQSKTLGN